MRIPLGLDSRLRIWILGIGVLGIGVLGIRIVLWLKILVHRLRVRVIHPNGLGMGETRPFEWQLFIVVEQRKRPRCTSYKYEQQTRGDNETGTGNENGIIQHIHHVTTCIHEWVM